MKEAQHTEWKESWRDEYLKWISGFANAEGGVPVPKLREEKPGLWVEFGFRAPVETPVKTPVETPVESLS